VRYILTFVALLVVVGALAAIKAAQIATLVAHGHKAQEQGPPPEVVGTAIGKDEVWDLTLSDVGSVATPKGATLSNEIAGVVTRTHFESGDRVSAGATLVELDTNVEREQLAAALSRLELASTTMGRTAVLARTGAIPRSQVDADQAQLETSTKDVAGLRATIARKNVRAPFAGTVGVRNVNVGQFLEVGTPITVIDASRFSYVDFTAPQEQLAKIAVGMPVRIQPPGDAGAPLGGTIQAVDPAVDPATRAAKVRAIIEAPKSSLRPGMFVDVKVVLPEQQRIVVVPSTALVHASYGDSIFVVEEKPANEPGIRTTPSGAKVMVARQQFVKTGESRGDFTAIPEGLAPGQEVVTAGAFKLRNGAPIVVDNRVQPKAELDPRPENR
jgi:membrane fusion protein (multidrug efflux system)